MRAIALLLLGFIAASLVWPAESQITINGVLQPTVQAANTTTDSNGVWTVTWIRPFNNTQPVVLPIPVNQAGLPVVCNVASRSATGASGACWQSTATTLPQNSVALLGLGINPFGMTAAGASVMVVAREPTQ